ncbi:YbaB/EbfC family nucleoid-associated protein [Couchioplanes azureus]|uniref:YbaB/EbfC family nucleoid-associated protein n=1 Tax=Couchioplanes caeruleus TaxID=56438 RepID=UPI0016708DAC|nr:YbaB/EbfC family nucleoid-associated protein [Couchioplanes caeruleus]GGQ87287.1 hypothetical protein GCM10010166_66850 [Couchioplanes caeruleus subsp. azureus]
MSSPELVSLDVLGSDEELRAAAADHTVPGAGAGAEPEVEGRDPTRAVVVRMDRRGRVTDVLISAWWRDELTPSGLQDAVLSAYRAALVDAAASIDPTSVVDQAPVRVRQPAEEPSEPDDRAWFENLRRRLDRIEDTLDSSRRLAQGQITERVVAGPAGLVRLIVSGFTISQVQIDTPAALQESPNRLAADALAAFHAAS